MKTQPFKYNFIVHPGADASQIKLQYKGANEIKLENGQIQIETSNGSFYESLPESWILENEQNIKVHYKAYDENTFGFNVSEYEKTGTLVVDPLPILDWATYYGGSEIDYISSIKVDQFENVYGIGTTKSNSNIATAGSFQDSFSGNYDAFILKLSASGQRIWATYIGGNSYDVGIDIKIDQNGYFYIVGTTTSNSGIATSVVYQDSLYSSYDAFIMKFNSSGQRIWGTYFGGNGEDYGNSIVISKNKHLYICGYTSSTIGISTTGTHQVTNAGLRDVFLARFDTSGQRNWGTYYGGSGSEYGHSIAIDTNEKIFITGRTNESWSKIATTGAHQTSYGGGDEAFIAKFDSTGHRIWGTYYGANSNDEGNSVTVDNHGNVFVAGYSRSSYNIATLGAYQSSKVGGSDAFIVKFTSSGQRIWGTYYGGNSNNNEVGHDIEIDRYGNIFMVGYTESTSGIATTGAHQDTFGGIYDAFLVKFDSSGQRIWATYFGGNSWEQHIRLANIQNKHIYIAGMTSSTSAISTSNAHQVNYGGGQDDVFIAKFFDCYPSYDTLNYTICDSFVFNGQPIFNSGIYCDTLLNWNGCDSFITLNLYILPNPKAEFFLSDSIQCYGDNSFYFSDSSSIDTGSIISYFWEFGDGDTSILQSPTYTIQRLILFL
jgi:hypothetical protein